MSLEKISVTLYDLLGYILPGFLILFGISVLEATFAHSQVFYIARLVKNPIVAAIMAYFLGQVAHIFAAWLKRQYRGLFTDNDNCLSTPLYNRARQEVRAFYDIPDEAQGGTKLRSLEMYQLTDAYLMVSGGHLDRDVFMAREGFAKSSMVALAFLVLTFVTCLFAGGARIQPQPSPTPLLHVSVLGTVGAALVAAAGAAVFRTQFLFFARLKNNYAMLTFLAHRQKEAKTAELVAKQAISSVETNTEPVAVPEEKVQEAHIKPQVQPPVSAVPPTHKVEGVVTTEPAVITNGSGPK